MHASSQSPREPKSTLWYPLLLLGYISISQGVFLLWDLQHGCQIQSRDIRFIERQSPTCEKFINLPNCLAQLVVPAPDNAEIHMDPISMDDDAYEYSSNGMDFDKASPLALIIDDMHIGQSGQELHTPSDVHIASDLASDSSSDADEADIDINSAQRMYIDAPHTRTPGTPREGETNQTIDDLTTSSSAIRVDPTKKAPKPRSKVVDPTPAPVRFFARLAKKKGHTTHTIDGPQPSVHTIVAVDLGDANPDPANIENALACRDHARWRLARHDKLTKMDQYGTWTVVCRTPKDINVVDTNGFSRTPARRSDIRLASSLRVFQ
jgi:hypothetical protein